MTKLYRAVYTRCYIGIDFNSIVSTGDGLKIFSTSGSMGLPREAISVIETEIKKDIYNAGLRPYQDEACRFFNTNNTSVLIHYRYLNQKDTGSNKGHVLAKALMGSFDSHPMEYYSPGFFKEGRFFIDYRDANGQAVSEFIQLHTYREETPPLFPDLTHEDLFKLPDCYPVMSFEQAGRFVMQSEHVAERVRAAVCHLVKQFYLSENQRMGIAVTGTIDEIRYWFAAIGYAFSARAAQRISFSIAFPPVGFSYQFSTAALVGWDVNDPDLSKLSRAPSNLVFLNDLPAADQSEYLNAISKFDPGHRVFINNFVKKSPDIISHPDSYDIYLQYNHYVKELRVFIDGSVGALDIDKLQRTSAHYVESRLYVLGFYDTVLKATIKAAPGRDSDIENLIAIFDTLEKMISDEVAAEQSSSAGMLLAELKKHYIDRFSDIFVSILSDRYSFRNRDDAKKPREFFVTIVAKKEDWAYEIARYLLYGDVVDKYLSGRPDKTSDSGGPSREKVVYSYLAFVSDLMIWHQQCGTDNIDLFTRRAFGEILQSGNIKGAAGIRDLKRKASHHSSMNLFDDVFCEICLGELVKDYPQSNDDVFDLIDIYASLEKMITGTVAAGNPSAAESLQRVLENDFISRIRDIMVSILSNELVFCNSVNARDPQMFFAAVEDRNIDWAAEIARYLTRDELIDRYTFSFKPDGGDRAATRYPESVIYPRLSFFSEMMKKSGKKESGSLVRYICKAFNSVLVHKHSSSYETIYVSVFLPFIDKDRDDVRGKSEMLTYRDCGYDPQNINNDRYFEQLEKVFLYEFKYKLIEIGKRSSNIEARNETARRYIQQCRSQGFSVEAMVSLYLESLDVEDEKSMFYYKYSTSLFVDQHQITYPRLFKRCVEKLLDKVLMTDKSNEKVDVYYLSLIIDWLILIYKYEGPEDIGQSIWGKCCEMVDDHLGKAFSLPIAAWEERFTSDKSPVYVTAKYLAECRFFLPNSDRVNLYSWLCKYKGRKDEMNAIIGVLKEYAAYSEGFEKCSNDYKEGIISVIGKKRWTGEFYCLILHLFDFDDQIISGIFKGLDGVKSTNEKLAFCELCEEMFDAYEEKPDDERFRKFLAHVKKVILYYRSNRNNKWDGEFFLLLLVHFHNDGKVIRHLLLSMLDEKAGGGVQVFCEFCVAFVAVYEKHKAHQRINDVWTKTEGFCREFKKDSQNPLYRKVVKELERLASKHPEVSNIISWLTPE